jgi:tetratricopeptide (TPR) repeat protein
MRTGTIPDFRGLSAFSGLNDSGRDYLNSHGRKFDFSPGQCIIQKGNRGQFMAIVDSGQVELRETGKDPQMLSQGQLFGYEMFRFGLPSSATVISCVETSLWVFTRQDWLAAVEMPAGVSRSQTIRRRTSRMIWIFAIIIVALGMFILYPDLLDYANHQISGMFISARQPQMAETYLKFAARLQPGSAQVHDALGYALFLQGEHAEAIAAFENAVANDPTLASAQNNLGVALLNQADAEQALNHLQEAVELNPGNADAYFNLGNAFMAVGDPDSALKAYQRAFELDPAKIDARASLAGIWMHQGRLGLARSAYTEILQANPNYHLALRGLGVIAVLEGKPEESLPYLQAARDADIKDAYTYFYLGLALEALDQNFDAAEEFERALALSADPELIKQAEAHIDGIQN